MSSEPLASPSVDHESAGSEPAHTVHVLGALRRGVAALADLLLMAPVCIAAGYVIVRLGELKLGSWRNLRPETLLDLVLQGNSGLYGLAAFSTLVALLYGFIFVATTGSTPGLRLLRGTVIDLYGNAPRPWRALLRATALVFSLALGGLGVFWIAFDHEKRGLHDRIAGTLVVHCSKR